MPSSRLLAPALALTLLTGPAVALAQDATPVTGSAAPTSAVREGTNAAGDPLVGTPVPYLNEAGDEIGTVTVVEVIDPFDDFSEFFDVDEGTRYVALEVAVSAAEAAANEENPVQANASDFGLQTTAGFFYRSTFASRDISSSDTPDLETITVDPGDDVTGLLFYQLPAGADLARLLWQPENGRLLLVADLRQSAAPDR